MAYIRKNECGLVKGFMVLAAHGVVLVAVLLGHRIVLYPRGYFGPPSSRSARRLREAH